MAAVAASCRLVAAKLCTVIVPNYYSSTDTGAEMLCTEIVREQPATGCIG